MSSQATVYYTVSNGATHIVSTLTLCSVRYWDKGQYTCSIQNEIGNDTATSTISIDYEGILVNGDNSCIIIILLLLLLCPATEITNLTADQMIVNESDSIRILCEARGSPPLMITWQRAISPNNIVRLLDNTHIHSTSTDESCNITVQQSIIEINNSRVEDGVEYICQAQNDLPYVVASERLKINVQSGSIVLTNI